MQGKLKIILSTVAVTLPLATLMYFYFNPAKENLPKNIISIAPPVKEADIPMDKYVFKPDSAIEIKRTTGTCIRIKPNTFHRQDGQPISGSVELDVREFHKAAEILRSGIPMNINKDRMEFLKSGGMIEMRAYNQGQPLEINEGKDIGVDLAGYRSPEGYSLYYLKDNAEWVVNDTFQTVANSEKAQLKIKMAQLPPPPVRKDTTSEDLVFSLAGNSLYAPQLETFANRKWKICGNYDESYLQKAMRINWDNFNIELINKEKKIYELVLSNTVNSTDHKDDLFQSATFKVTPVFNDCKSSLDSEFFESQMKEYNIVLQKMEEEKKRIERQGDLLNTFTAKKMGIYNIDRLYKAPELESLPITFDFEQNIEKRINKIELFGVYEEENSVVKYEMKEWNTVGFSRNKSMKLIAMLPGDKVAVVENDAIQKALSSGAKELHFQTRKFSAGAYFRESGNFLASR